MNVCVGQNAILSEDHCTLKESAFDALVRGARKLHLFERGPSLRTLAVGKDHSDHIPLGCTDPLIKMKSEV